MDKKIALLPLATAALALGPYALMPAATATAPSGTGVNLVETAEAAQRFDTLLAALGATGLDQVLAGPGPFTVFAPTDNAFAALPPGTLETLLLPENQELLTSILLYHVVPGQVLASDVVNLSFAQTANGQRVDIALAGGGVQIDQANVLATDVLASNGVIHVIDSVLLPVTTDLPATLASTKRFETLLAAVGAADLVAALESAGPLTVLAPTDFAFSMLPPGTVDSLLLPQNKALLTEILLYHVIPGRVYSDQALSAGQAATLQGGNVSFSIVNGRPFVNDSRIRFPDREASNGVFHVIDKVLLP